MRDREGSELQLAGHWGGGLKEVLVKPTWHAFIALDLDRSNKVSAAAQGKSK